MEARILKIDLTNRSYGIEVIPDKIRKQFLGGRGLGAYLLYKEVPAKTDPLSEQNHLIFAAGPANGTGFYFSSKVSVTTKSPLTDIYLFAMSSGSFGHWMKRAGLWAIDIEGIAKKPTYIDIDNEKVEFKDATPLWGKNPAEAQQAMLGGKKGATAAIGAAGEKLINYAAIFSEGQYYRAFGRGGSGCVMGAKKLKGIVVSGDREVEIADKARFDAAKAAVMANIKANPKWAKTQRDHGTGFDIDLMSERAILPTRNWQKGTFEGYAGICTSLTDSVWPRKSIPCGPYCPATCSHYIQIEKGPYKGAHCDGPEYETLYTLGSNLEISNYDAIIAAAQLCDEFGIDSMTAGLTLGFAIECFEKGLIGLKDTDGIPLRFGDAELMMTLLNKMVRQEGFGKKLALGVKKLSEEIKGSEEFAMHVKGLELGGYECRDLNGQALQFAVCARGGCHHAYGLPARVEAYDGTSTKVEGKAEWLAKKVCPGQMMNDCFPSCSFRRLVLTQPIQAEAVSAITGEPWSVEDFGKVAQRLAAV
ncbi:MAG: aldehyde ferredoxin oxidoreductase C-terminal domain-containing protein, partial [Chloroflexota bacterium]|nr:aldehyde ferredoxin oxidoreductase C-terminal domain-containing protein [Chloroflexota bacterium]